MGDSVAHYYSVAPVSFELQQNYASLVVLELLLLVTLVFLLLLVVVVVVVVVLNNSHWKSRNG